MFLSPSSFWTYFLFDIAVILTLFGYYGSSQYDMRNVFEAFIGYSFYTSPLDFLLISLLRLVAYSTSYLMRASEKCSLVAWLDKPITSLFVASISFSFLKCLIFSELKSLQGCTNVFILPVWNILSAAYFYRLWLTEFELCFEKEKEDEDEKEDYDIPITNKEQIVILARYAYGNLPLLLFGTVISLCATAVNVAQPHYKSLVMNGITALREGVDIQDSIKIVTALTLASMVLSGLQSGILDYLQSTMISKMRKDLFDSIINQEIAFFEKYKSGVIISRITWEVGAVASRITCMFTGSPRSLLTIFGKVMFMGSLSWRLTLINFIAFPVIIYISKLSGEFERKMSNEEDDSVADSYQVSEEIITTIRTIRSFGAEKRSSKKFVEAVERTRTLEKKEAIASIVRDFSWDLYYNGLYVIVLMYGAKLVSEGRLEPSSLVTFMMYQMGIGYSVVGITNVVPRFLGTLGKSRKFCQFLIRQPKIKTDGKIEQPLEGALSLTGVSFTYPHRPTNQVLHDFTLHIRAGETLALVGPSGGGKSTIVALIERFYDPDEGEITLDGVTVKEFDHEYYHRKIALVAQEPVLYDCSVKENIGFGCDCTEEEIIEAAKMANAHDFVIGLEKGYETTCGERGTQISGGQKQRIAIARALVRRPSILILDEATSALDNKSEQIVQEAMQRCSGERTVIVIAHRLSTIEKADRIAVIDKGKVVQLGTHNELLKDMNGLYYTLVRAKDNND